MRPSTGSLAGFLFVVLSAGSAMIAPRSLCATIRELPTDIEPLYNQGLYRQATEALNAAIEREPRGSSLHFWLGRCFFEMREYNRAIYSLERAVALEPDRSDYHYWLGKSYGRQTEETSRSTALSALSLAHKTHPRFAPPVQRYANVLE